MRGNPIKNLPPSTSILDVLNSRKVKETAKVMKTSGTFTQAAAWPPSPDPLASVKAAIASAAANFMAAVKKHQDNFQSLLKSAAPGILLSVSKIKQLRADNIALMTAATTRVQHAGGTRFSLKTLYDHARSEEKEARRLVDKEFAHNSTLANAKDAATMMSSITDSDGYTTISRRGRSPTTSPPRPHPQPEGKEGNRKNPF